METDYDYDAHRVICTPEGEPYLVRFTVLKLFGWRLKLHVFVRGDEDRCLHDHPWGFWTLILFGGYHEETREGVKWRRPGSLLYRPAEWSHRVILGDTPACTLVLMGPRRRSWGFLTRNGWVHWRDYLVPGRGGHEC